MKILFWNTCYTTDPQDLFKDLMILHQSLKIDYFCLNEATPALITLLEKDSWQVFYKQNTDERKVLIFSKHPLRKKRAYLLSHAMRDGRDNDNHLLMIEVFWRQQPMTLATTHLTYWRPREIARRRLERKILVKHLPRQNTIFGGDLNTIIFPFSKWDIISLGFQSRIKGKTWCWHLRHTFRRIPFKLQLDHVFATHDISTAVSARILKERRLSDHFPILVELE